MQYDVVVVGCGIAGLSAAVAALQEGAKVAILERARKEDRGGNTRWTEAFMRMKNEDEVSDDFEEHFMNNSGFHLDPGLMHGASEPYDSWSSTLKAHPFSDPEMVGTLAALAPETLKWLKTFGIRFSDMASYLITQSTTRICPVGGGRALVEALAAFAEANGATFHYETTAYSLSRDETGMVTGVNARIADGSNVRFTGRVVLGCGGFEGNPEMLSRYLGSRARYIRPVAPGGYFNKGEGIRMALEIGAAGGGDFSEYHAEPIDPRSGASEPIVFVFPYGILVDRNGRRFVDEGSDTVDAIYENISRMIDSLPGGVAYAICDARLDDVPNWQRTVRSDQPPITAASIEELAQRLQIPAHALKATVDSFNAAVQGGEFKPLQRDGLATDGINPPKSNWARRIENGPFRAWPISSANCFTFGGLKCNSSSQVLDTDGRPIKNLYAAGEIVGLYHGRYTGATSVLRGAVFGRLAGRNAANMQ